MIIQQLSVFLENKSGRLNEILDMLGNANIRIIAATVADTSEYGILRLITSDTPQAFQVLRNHGVSANQSDVLVISCDSQAGSFAHTLKHFADENIGIEYMYCFSVKSKAFLILRTSDRQAALSIVSKYQMNGISEKELIQL